MTKQEIKELRELYGDGYRNTKAHIHVNALLDALTAERELGEQRCEWNRQLAHKIGELENKIKTEAEKSATALRNTTLTLDAAEYEIVKLQNQLAAETARADKAEALERALKHISVENGISCAETCETHGYFIHGCKSNKDFCSDWQLNKARFADGGGSE